MRNPAHQLLLTALAVAVLGAAAAAQQPPRKGGGMGPMYDMKSETTVKGTVESVEDVTSPSGRRSMMGMHLSLKTDKETLEVHVGPMAFMKEKGITIEKGDTVEILGSRVTMAGETVLLARRITMDGKTFELRDDTGRPLWSGRPK